MSEFRALLAVDKTFESGLRLKAYTPIYVREMPGGYVGHFYDDPMSFSCHVFALEPDEFSVLLHRGEREIIEDCA